MNWRVPGVPVPKGRPRFGRNRKTGAPVTRTPDATRAYEELVARVCMYGRDAVALDEPVVLHVDFVLPRPGTRHPLVDSATWATGERCHAPLRGRLDFDNLVKAIADGLQLRKLGRSTIVPVLRDDGLIVEAHVRRLYAARGEEPCAEIHLFRLTDAPAGS